MARHAALTMATDLPVYFAHPRSPWERGSNENTNRLIREYLPKGTDIPQHQPYLTAIAEELNERPEPPSATSPHEKPSKKHSLLPPLDTKSPEATEPRCTWSWTAPPSPAVRRREAARRSPSLPPTVARWRGR